MDTKHCKKCDQTKPVDQFGTCRGKPAYRCLECQRAGNKTYAKSHPEVRKACQRRYISKKSQDLNFVTKHREHSRKVKQRRRLEVLTHYCGGTPECSCCGENNFEFLTIDHVDGGGNEHRREIGGSGRLCGWLKKNGYPPGYRVLCSNCNLAYGAYGYCPHQRDRNAVAES